MTGRTPAAAITTVIIAAITASLVLTGCGHDEPVRTRLVGGASDTPTNADGIELVPPGGPGAPRGDLPAPRSVDQRDPGDVADAVAITNYVVDTRVDTSPMDGLRRARGWLSPDYAAAVAEPIPASGGADWISLAEVDGYTTATLTEADETRGGKRTITSAVVTRIATVTRRDAAGRALSTDEIGTFITLTRTGASSPWRVTQITTG